MLSSLKQYESRNQGPISQPPTRGAPLALLAGVTLVLAGCSGEVPQPAPASKESSAGKAENGVESASASANTAGTKRLLLITNGNSPFWDACRVGVQDAERELKLRDAGLSATLVVNDGSTTGQIQKLRQYATQSDIAGIGISAVVANNAEVADELKRLRENGVPVVTVDSDVDREHYSDVRFAFIGTDNFTAGKEMGVCLKHLVPDGGAYVTFVGKTDAQNAQERVAGVTAGAGEMYEHRDNMGDEIEASQARQNVRTALGNHPGLKALVGIWSYNGPAIVDVVKEKGIRDRIKVLTFDAEPNSIGAMADGQIDAMLVQNPYQMGYQGVRLLKALVEKDDATIAEMFPNHGQDGGDIYDTGQKVVVPDSGSPLTAELFLESTQFMTLGAFKEWLNEYDLEGS